MYINDKSEIYEAIKIIRHSLDRSYVCVPKWLIHKNVKITVIDTEAEIIRKVNKNSTLSFPEIMGGQRVKIIYLKNEKPKED